MKTYIIQYWYNTDLRHEEKIQANNEIEAFTVTNNKLERITGDQDWTGDNPNFFIKIYQEVKK